MNSRGFLFPVLAWLLCVDAQALDRDLSMDQFVLRNWGAKDSAPADVNAFTQTADGRFWLGTSHGLWTFDGISFQPVAIGGPQALPSTNITAMRPAAGNALWLGYQLGGVSLLSAATLKNFGAKDGVPAGTVHAIVEDGQGVVWFATDGGVASHGKAGWQAHETVRGLPPGPALGAFVDHAGTLWVASGEALYARAAGQAEFRKVGDLPGDPGLTRHFAEAPDGAVWLSVPEGGIRRVRSGVLESPAWIADRATGPIAFDRDGSLWMAGKTLRRATDPGAGVGFGPNSSLPRIETFSRAQGLSSDTVRNVFEDREGNLWIATDAGLDGLFQGDVVKVNVPGSPGGGKTLVAGDAGTVWVADALGPSVMRLDHGKLALKMAAPGFTAGLRDREGGIWFAGRAGIARVSATGLETTPLPAGARGFDVQAMTHDTAGAIWVSVERAGLFRFMAGAWAPHADLPGLPHGAALSALAGAAGEVWLGYPDGRLARVTGDVVKVFDAADGLNVGAVTALHARGSWVWIGGETGLAVYDGGRIRPLTAMNCSPFNAVSGISETEGDELWLFRGTGLTRVRNVREQLRANDSAGRLNCQGLGRLDNSVPGAPQQMRPTPSLIQATDGRLWLAATNGLGWIDIAHIDRKPAVPSASFIYFIAAGAPRPLAGAQLPPHTHDIRVGYTSWSLNSPITTRFRYRLENVEREWQSAARERSIAYANLGPGHYRLLVSATNDEVVWSDPPASLEFEILPAFYQTSAFLAACAFSGLALAWLLYRRQVRRATEQMRALLEERVTERERIARELHDTLLQGTQALIFKVESVASRVRHDEVTHGILSEALDHAEDVMTEGRGRIQDLRLAAGDDSDLPVSLAAVGEELSRSSAGVSFRAVVEGNAITIEPTVRDELYRIGREALLNAFHHGRARSIELQFLFGATDLRIRVRDDGVGFDASTLRTGSRPGHWGLQGMRERARSIGAQIDIWSRPEAGTEIELRLPAAAAYVPPRRATRWLPLLRLAGGRR